MTIWSSGSTNGGGTSENCVCNSYGRTKNPVTVNPDASVPLADESSVTRSWQAEKSHSSVGPMALPLYTAIRYPNQDVHRDRTCVCRFRRQSITFYWRSCTSLQYGFPLLSVRQSATRNSLSQVGTHSNERYQSGTTREPRRGTQ